MDVERFRIGDADRQWVIARLQAHCAVGRLSMDEMLERSAAAQAAVTRAELTALLRDLPEDVEPVRRGWHDPAWRVHASVAALVTGGVIGLWQVTRDPDPLPRDYGAGYWWPLWFGLFWAVLVLLHFLYAAGQIRLPARLRAQPAPRAAPEPPAPAAPAPEPLPAALGTLTDREREILVLVAEGCANKEIARRLFISERTARTHVSNILRKLDLPSRTQAALVAVRAGLVPPQREDLAGDGDRPDRLAE